MTTPRLLLTGATDGIGRALAHALHARGVRLVAHGRSAAKLAELAAELPGIETTVADFARLADVAALAQRLLADASPLDGLFNALEGVSRCAFQPCHARIKPPCALPGIAPK